MIAKLNKFRIVIEQTHKETFEMILEEEHLIVALDKSRSMVAARNKTCDHKTIYCVKKIEEIKK